MIDETWEKPAPPVMKNRPCLNCDALFMTSNFIRICPKCKLRREWKEAAGVHYYSFNMGKSKMQSTANLVDSKRRM